MPGLSLLHNGILFREVPGQLAPSMAKLFSPSFRHVILPTLLVGWGLVQGDAFGADPDWLARLENAFAKLQQAKGWEHLDLTWIDKVAAMSADGPEMNVELSVLGPDGKPVPRAVVALQESIQEAEKLVSLRPGPFQPVRAVRSTNASGKCRFESIRMTPAASGKPGRIGSYMVVAHPEYGFDYLPLLRTSRLQKVEMIMSEQTPMRLVVKHASQAAFARIVKFENQPHYVLGFRGFQTDRVFCPRAAVDSRGMGEFARLPKGRFVSFEVKQNERWTRVETKMLFQTDVSPARVQPLQPPSRIPVRFLDAATSRPISRVGVDRWMRPEQTSDDDGRLTINPTFSFRSLRIGKFDRVMFTITPPRRWVRETIMDYRHPIGGPAPTFRLMPATTIQGRVVDSKDGAGIAGVVVQSIRPHNRPGGVTSQFHAIAVSDQTGAFELSAPPGRQVVSIAAPVSGFLLPADQRVSVVMGKPTKPIKIKLKPATEICGRIVDKDGAAVTGAEVICHSADRTVHYRGGFPVDSTIVSARTNLDGEFEIDRPPGQYDSLMLKAVAGTRHSRDAVIEFDHASNRPIEVDLELSVGDEARVVELVGKVIKDGKPTAGVVVTADPPPPRTLQGNWTRFRGSPRGKAQLGEAITDPNGEFQMRLKVSDVDSVRIGVRSHQQSKLVDLNAPRIKIPTIDISEMIGTETIRGVVVDPQGSPVSGVKVSANRQRLPKPDPRNPVKSPHHAVTDAKGVFRLASLADGPIEVSVSPIGLPLGHGVSSDVTIAAGQSDARIVFDPTLSRVPEQIEPVQVQDRLHSKPRIAFVPTTKKLEPSATIRGTVVDQRERPVDQAIVRVFCITPIESISDHNPLSHAACRLVTRTDSQGQFAIGPMPKGVRVRIAAGGSGLSAQITDFLTIGKHDEIAKIELTRFDPDLPSMKTTHQLIDAVGAPVPGAIVSTGYQPYDDILQFRPSKSEPCVLTDGQGRFRFPTVAGIDYQTVAAFPIDGPSTVIQNQYSHRKYRLADSMAIRGRVVDSSGQFITGLALSVTCARLPGVIRVVTKRDGTFRVADLPCAESYELSGRTSSPPSHFLIKRTFNADRSQDMDFGDLEAKPSSQLKVKLIPANGKSIPADLHVQVGRRTLAVSPNGELHFPSLPPTSVGMRLIGKAAIARTNPLLHRFWGDEYRINTEKTDTIVIHLE